MINVVMQGKLLGARQDTAAESIPEKLGGRIMDTQTQGKGECLCGAVGIISSSLNTQVGTCHCRMCRRWGGGPLMTVDCGTDVSFTGEEKISLYDSSEWARRGFCSQCGSHLFYLLKEDGRYFVPVGLFDSEEQFQFVHQIFIDKKPSFYSFANVTDNLTEEEVFGKYSQK